MARRNYEEAAELFHTATRFTMANAVPYVNLSIVYNMLGENDKAEEILLKAIQVEPENASAYYNLGLLYAEKNMAANAKNALLKAYHLDSLLDGSAYNLAILASSYNPEEALEWIGKALMVQPNSIKYLYTEAYFYYLYNQKERSMEILLRILETDKTFVSAYLLLSEIYTATGKTSEAVKLLKSVLNQNHLTQKDKSDLQAALRPLLGGSAYD
jgi:tetratricopeptide (TPR) repeat protein